MAVLAAALVVSTGSAAGAAARDDAAFDGASWLANQQKSGGAFVSTSQKANDTAITLASLVAGGVGGEVVGDALAYIRKHGKARTTRGAFTGQIIAGIVAGGANPRNFGGYDYVKKLRSQYKNGAYDSSQLFPDLLAVNGALAAGEDIPDDAIEYIASHECDGGGFGYEERCARGPDTDSTSLAINVLVEAGAGGALVDRARDFLLDQQHSDGGWGFTKDLATSADSTGLALSAVEALGEGATTSPWRQSDGDDPVKALLALQDPSGGFRFTKSAAKPNAMSTINAVPGLAGHTYPIPAGEGAPPKPPKTPKPTPAPTAAAEERGSDDGSTKKKDGNIAPSATDDADPRGTPSPSTTPEQSGSANAAVALTDQEPNDDAPFADSAEDLPQQTSNGSGVVRTGLALVGIGAGGTGIALGIRALRRRTIL